MVVESESMDLCDSFMDIVVAFLQPPFISGHEVLGKLRGWKLGKVVAGRCDYRRQVFGVDV